LAFPGKNQAEIFRMVCEQIFREREHQTLVFQMIKYPDGKNRLPLIHPFQFQPRGVIAG